MTAAEATVKEGGVIIMLAASNDGIGGEHFCRQLAEEPDMDKTMACPLSWKNKYRKTNNKIPGMLTHSGNFCYST